MVEVAEGFLYLKHKKIICKYSEHYQKRPSTKTSQRTLPEIYVG